MIWKSTKFVGIGVSNFNDITFVAAIYTPGSYWTTLNFIKCILFYAYVLIIQVDTLEILILYKSFKVMFSLSGLARVVHQNKMTFDLNDYFGDFHAHHFKQCKTAKQNKVSNVKYNYSYP